MLVDGDDRGGRGLGRAGADERLDLGGAVVTPGLVNTHTTSTRRSRAPAQQADLFTWLGAVPRVGGDRRGGRVRRRAHRARRAGALGLLDRLRPPLRLPARRAGIFEAEVEAARELGVRLVASRGSMDLGVSDGGLPPDELVEELDAVLAETERLHGALHEDGPGARVQLAVAPCSPFSVTGRLMEESAALARRLGLVLHTHLAETVEEEAYCRGALRLLARRVPRAARLARRRRVVRPLRPPLRRRGRAVRRDGDGRRALPDVEPAPRRGRRAGAVAARRGRAVGLGVDGSASNERSDLFLEVKQALLVARGRRRRR